MSSCSSFIPKNYPRKLYYYLYCFHLTGSLNKQNLKLTHLYLNLLPIMKYSYLVFVLANDNSKRPHHH